MSEHEEDQDSLFGSPPPSPQQRPRPLSPALALPGGGRCGGGTEVSHSATATIQNVGTIALPGSQPLSELPMNPLALSLSHGVVSRPPAPVVSSTSTPSGRLSASISRGAPNVLQSRNANDVSSLPRHNDIRASTSSRPKSPKSTTAATAVPSSAASKGKKRSRAPSQALSTSRTHSPTPDISFPDPSAPPPTNFLRNQQNLLGKAGLVGGVKASRLVQPHAKGKSASNPIVLDDDDEIDDSHRPEGSRDGIGRRRSRSASRNLASVDSSKLKPPSNQDIVQVLIGQKNIFSVLQDILKILSDNSPLPHGPTGFERRDPSKPPVKRRKLNRVPAGAADWDVPFPFAQGEGPEKYRATWKKERGKQLIVQLVTMIKDAVKKAAVKNFLKEQEKAKGEGEKSPFGKASPTHDDASTSTVLGLFRDSTLAGLQATAPSTRPSHPSNNAISTYLPTPPPSTAPSACSSTSTTSDFPSNPQDQALFDSWMSFMATFPMSVESMSNFASPLSPVDTTHTNTNTPSSSTRATPSLEDFDFSTFQGFDFGDMTYQPSGSVSNSDTLLGLNMDPLPGGAQSDSRTMTEEMDLLSLSMGMGAESSLSGSGQTASRTNASTNSIPRQDHVAVSSTDCTTNLGSFRTTEASQGYPLEQQSDLLDPELLALLLATDKNSDMGSAVDPFFGQVGSSTETLMGMREFYSFGCQYAVPGPGAPSSISSRGDFEPTTSTHSTGGSGTTSTQLGDPSGQMVLVGGAGDEMGGVEPGRPEEEALDQGMLPLWDGFDFGTYYSGMGLGFVGASPESVLQSRQMGIENDVQMAVPGSSFLSLHPPPSAAIRPDKGKGKAVGGCDVLQLARAPSPSPTCASVAMEETNDLHDTTDAPQPSTPLDNRLGGASTNPASNSFHQVPVDGTKKQRRDAIVRRGQERMKQLQAELDQVKMQLWQTTIEQAALIQLANSGDQHVVSQRTS